LNLEVLTILQDLADDKVSGKTAIVFDILRCTTSIVTALANGCREVIPVSSEREALELYNRSPDPALLLSGEHGGSKIPDFHLGNSPLEFTSRRVRDRTVIMTTTNGTLAIKKCRPAYAVFIGSFLNISAVCRKAVAAGRDIVVICAGSKGKIALEDLMAAGMVVAVCRRLVPGIRMVEPSATLYHLYEYLKNNMKQAVYTSRSGINLQSLGLQGDIDYSLKKNRYSIVPVYKENSIHLGI
jgi:2-phosphosulfolactate phosphatase